MDEEPICCGACSEEIPEFPGHVVFGYDQFTLCKPCRDEFKEMVNNICEFLGTNLAYKVETPDPNHGPEA